MKPKLALAIFLLVVSDLTAYRAGKRVADWWYAPRMHPPVIMHIPLDVSTATAIGGFMCISGTDTITSYTTTTGVTHDVINWIRYEPPAPKKPRKP